MSLNTDYQTFIAKSRYARWDETTGKREDWGETVDRYINFFSGRYPKVKDSLWNSLRDAIYNLEVMPSMRCLMTAGKALERDNVAGFNCSYAAIEGGGSTLTIFTDEMKHAGFDEAITIKASDPIAFDELMYVLMCGTGAGFSVERQFISSLPVVGHKLPRGAYSRNEKNFPGVEKEELSTFSRAQNTIYVTDSKYGWASALRILIIELYNGNTEIGWDLSKVRAAGERLKIFGGRSSGPGPLDDLFRFATNLFAHADGRKLTSIECHGLVCKIAEIVVVGGVRRSALISLSNLTDGRMRTAKSGQWWDEHPEFGLANNSVAYTEKPDIGIFMEEWKSLYNSKSGERGIFNREAAKLLSPSRRDTDKDFGTNPCSEIVLRNKQFCNLTEVVVRPEDTFEDLTKKVEYATILGTLQATLTDFKYLSTKWKENTEEEALLGVSFTGIMDHHVMSGSLGIDDEFAYDGDFPPLRVTLDQLKEIAINVNKKWANTLGINQAAAITCVKPSGTVSQLVDSASGIHPRYSEYYIRTVRGDKKDPLTQFLIDQGVTVEDDIRSPGTTTVFSFPMKAPPHAIMRDDRTAIEQLELWKTYALNWCEHKPSITVYVREEEWLEVGAWCYKNFDILSGVSFLPHTDHTYPQAPYQEIDGDTYNTMKASFPVLAWEKLVEYESGDNTISSQELACTAGGCEI